MKFRIPFTISRIERLKRRIGPIKNRIRRKKDTKLEEYLKSANIDLTREEYIAIAIRSFLLSFIGLFIVATTVLAIINTQNFLIYSLGIAVLFSSFIFFSQIVYPKIYITRKQRNIDRNLIPALQDMLVQLNSGIPLFSIMVNISAADYDELSSEFKKAVRRINTGEPAAVVLDALGKSNPSIYFRRTLWQISNGMRSGADMSIVIQDSIKALNEEQLIQIQNYGNRLNPLIMLYMLISVIIPSLSVTFLTVISSMVNLSETTTQLLFITLFVFVVFVQIMFLGMVKARRPTLL